MDGVLHLVTAEADKRDAEAENDTLTKASDGQRQKKVLYRHLKI